MNRIILFLAFVLTASLALQAQENYKDISQEENAKFYAGSESYEVERYEEPETTKKPKNVILLIGDGMGVSQIYAGITGNLGEMYIQNFKKIGFQTTYSARDYTTDSAAAGTALATGKKTYNGAIGVDATAKSIENIREKCEKRGMATGVVATVSVTHATPAAFVAHQPQRSMYEAIAADFLKTDIDVFIGGGYKQFTERRDGRNLVDELEKKGYKVETDIKKVAKVKKGKLAGLLSAEHLASIEEGRGNMLETATETAIKILSKDSDGFFLMAEGSQIDWAGHQHSTSFLVTETHDFDKTIGLALEFAAKDKETLVIVTADHETGGFSIIKGNMETGDVLGEFSTGDHTGVMIPVFAFGPGSEEFTGFYDNTDIPKKIEKLLED